MTANYDNPDACPAPCGSTDISQVGSDTYRCGRCGKVLVRHAALGHYMGLIDALGGGTRRPKRDFRRRRRTWRRG